MQHGLLNDGRRIIINEKKNLTRMVSGKEFFVDTQTYAEVLLDGHWQLVRKDRIEPLGYGYDPFVVCTL